MTLRSQADDVMIADSQNPISLGWAQVSSCPLCSSGVDSHRAFASLSAEGITLDYAMCTRCGLVFQSRRLSAETLRRHYRFEYHHRRHSQEADPKKDAWVQARRAEHLVRFLRQHRTDFRRHLDIGSSSGMLLEATQRALGCEGYGVEPSERERAEAVARGVQTYPSLDEVPEDAGGSFDLVTLSHVLEHLPAPIATLQQIRQRWLAGSGLLLIETPNLHSHPCFELGHLTVFSSASLRNALGAAGFAMLDLRRHGRPYSRLFPLFLLALSESAGPADQPINRPPHPRWVQLRRWAGLTSLRAARLAGRLLLGRRRLAPWAS